METRHCVTKTIRYAVPKVVRLTGMQEHARIDFHYLGRELSPSEGKTILLIKKGLSFITLSSMLF
jgi:hypothetical protein